MGYIITNEEAGGIEIPLFTSVFTRVCHGVHINKRRSRGVTWDRSAGDTADLVHTLCRARLSLPHTLQTTPNVEVAAVVVTVVLLAVVLVVLVVVFMVSV